MNETTSPKVSVIIPCYNSEKFLEDCLNSVVNQTIFDDIEVIVVNDGSTDGSKTVADAYSEIFSNIKVVNRENGGLSAARNTGLQYAKGEFIAFLDADDKVPRDAYEKMYNSAAKFDADIVFGRMVNFNSSGTFPIKNVEKLNVFTDEYCIDDISKLPIILTIPSCCDKLFRRTTIIQSGVAFDEDLVYCEDGPFTVQMLCSANRIAILPNVVYYYRKHDENEHKSKTNFINTFEYVTYRLRALELILSNFNRLNNNSISNFIKTEFVLNYLYKYIDKLLYFSEQQRKTLFDRIHVIFSDIEDSIIDEFAKRNSANAITIKLIKYGQFEFLQSYFAYIKKKDTSFWKNVVVIDGEFWLLREGKPLFTLVPVHIGEIESVHFIGNSIVIQGFSFILANYKSSDIIAKNLIFSNRSGTQNVKFSLKSIDREDVSIYGDWLPIESGFYIKFPLSRLKINNLVVSIEFSFGLKSYSYKLPTLTPLSASNGLYRFHVNNGNVKVKRYNNVNKLLFIINKIIRRVTK